MKGAVARESNREGTLSNTLGSRVEKKIILVVKLVLFFSPIFNRENDQNMFLLWVYTLVFLVVLSLDVGNLSKLETNCFDKVTIHESCRPHTHCLVFFACSHSMS